MVYLRPMQDDRLDHPELFEAPYIACAICGRKVPMARHYMELTLTHLDYGRHEVIFIAESELAKAGGTGL